jgi:hypothetical protein
LFKNEFCCRKFVNPPRGYKLVITKDSLSDLSQTKYILELRHC